MMKAKDLIQQALKNDSPDRVAHRERLKRLLVRLQQTDDPAEIVQLKDAVADEFYNG